MLDGLAVRPVQITGICVTVRVGVVCFSLIFVLDVQVVLTKQHTSDFGMNASRERKTGLINSLLNVIIFDFAYVVRHKINLNVLNFGNAPTLGWVVDCGYF